ncbi:DMT family transporter [Aquimarina sp. ERC-38]|nr:DMT family transporter [Aquimarina sp. ERC-38]
MNITVKYLSGFSAAQLVFFRSLGSLFFTVPLLIKNRISPLGNQRKWLVLRGVAGVTSMGLFFWSVQYLAIGTAVSLRYLAPIFASIFALLFLKEKIKILQFFFFGIAFSGVLLIKGFDHQLQTTGLVLVVGSAISSGFVYVLINKIGKHDHPVVIVNYFMMIAVFVGGIFSIFFWQKNPNISELLMLLSLGISGYFGQLFMTKAFQSQATNKVVSLKYVEVLFTLLGGVLLLGDNYTLISLVGMVLVITGLVLNITYKTSSS